MRQLNVLADKREKYSAIQASRQSVDGAADKRDAAKERERGRFEYVGRRFLFINHLLCTARFSAVLRYSSNPFADNQEVALLRVFRFVWVRISAFM